jgi:hypothetical protein
MGAVAWATRQRSVSHPRSSNRTCPIKASGSPTAFNIRHTEKSSGRKRPLRDHSSPSPYDTAFSEGSGSIGVARLIANHLHLAIFESTPEVRVLCSASITRPRRSYNPVRLPPEPPAVRPLPSVTTDLPRLPASPFRRAVPTTPADRAGAHIDSFPAHAAFPKWQEGRHPHCHFRGLPGFTRVTARRIAQPPEATFLTRLQPVPLPARAARQLPDQSTTLRVELPPLVA